MNQNIIIPKPCHEDWGKMTPNSEGKFCGSCSKTVVDFTQMSKDEIHTYFKQKSGENTCGHFYASQLDVTKKVSPYVFKRINYWATLLLGLFLPLTSCKKQLTGEPTIKDDKQTEVELTGDTVYSGSDKKIPPMPKVKSDTVKEKIVNGVTLVKPIEPKDSIK